MSERKPLSKKRRFDIFKRDAFACQYCGRTPPAVVLEVDHVTAVANGGTNAEHNLITACFDCNRGKSAGTLAPTSLNTKEKATILAERLEQSKAYDQLLQTQRDLQDVAINKITEIFGAAFEGWGLLDNTRPSIRKFLEKLPFIEVVDSMEKACARTDKDRAFKYFCGICWSKIKAND